MKRIIFYLALATLAATANAQFVNISNQQERVTLPTAAVEIGGSVYAEPSFAKLKLFGWRIQNAITNPGPGFVVLGRTWVDAGGTFATAVLSTRTTNEQAQIDADVAAQVAAQVAAFKDQEARPANWQRKERAAIELLVEENNTLRQWLVDFKAQVAAASTLADLKTRVSTLPATPVRTETQIKNALRNKLDTY